nr:hypothetical protein [Tanacetum cinerariifolium]
MISKRNNLFSRIPSFLITLKVSLKLLEDHPKTQKTQSVPSPPPFHHQHGLILSGVLVSADTELPVTIRVNVNLRWAVGIPSDFDKQLPYLRVNKIDWNNDGAGLKKTGLLLEQYDWHVYVKKIDFYGALTIIK